jgi:hypothetical protein
MREGFIYLTPKMLKITSMKKSQTAHNMQKMDRMDRMDRIKQRKVIRIRARRKKSQKIRSIGRQKRINMTKTSSLISLQLF